MLRQSLKRAYERGEDHGRRDALQGCVLLVGLKCGAELSEWLLREMMSFSVKRGDPRVTRYELHQKISEIVNSLEDLGLDELAEKLAALEEQLMTEGVES